MSFAEMSLAPGACGPRGAQTPGDGLEDRETHMKRTLRRLAARIHNKFRGLYWRQMSVTVGMVLLTLLLLGASFFALSYNYARGQRDEELAAQARWWGSCPSATWKAAGTLTSRSSSTRRTFSTWPPSRPRCPDVDFLICDVEGHVLLSTDETLSGLVVTMPTDMTAEVLEDGITSRRTDVDGLYANRRFVVGVPAAGTDSPDPAGVVYAVSATTSLDNMWSGFIGLFFMTAFVVLMISFMASSVTTMRQIQPSGRWARATRRYAEGDFDIRMNDYGRGDELGELAASFNNMAESLQQTERQRREFIANISHELKTPMTTIAGYTDGILDGTIPPENERQYLQIISDESRRLSRLVRRMLDVSQLQVMDPLREGKHFDICESMRRVLISMEKKITDRRLDVEADIPEEPILVLGDKDMITQVIYNLLENATKFAREGSTLYLGVVNRDGKACVTVRNVGETIPPEELPLLFERFHKSDKSRSEDKDGYGLGLYIVKTILEQHKEKISVTSEDGVTTFSSLPGHGVRRA